MPLSARPAKATVLLSALIAIAAPANAEVLGCYGRSYSAEHLAANPGQQVQQIRAKRYTEPGDAAEFYDIRVHFRDDPREFTAATYCQSEGGRQVCIVECDGGRVYPVRGKDGKLSLSTEYLRAETDEALPGQTVGEGDCDGPVTRSIADQDAKGEGVQTVFVLQPRKSEECGWN